MREEKEEYREYLVSEEGKRSGRFNVNQPINLDSLLAFLDFYFSDREKSIEETSHLLDEIMEYEVSIIELVKALEKVEGILLPMGKDTFGGELEGGRWSQAGIVRAL